MATRRTDSSGVLRIIGGSWRGRKLRFKSAPGLRPTPDRVRETLFNWITPDLHGANCLDLFAGSGALGLEALSRGAASCTFVDDNSASIASIREHLHTLDCQSAQCVGQDACSWLTSNSPARVFDIVFLDPPFKQQLAAPACQALEAGNWLAPEARVYLETSVHEADIELPANWALRRDKTAGEVRYRLFVRLQQFV
ncbi:MAG: 16S rRNA (guanine(966)-N(2))-methyltransferase RsmD [Halieaceae bacterium]